MQQILNVPAVGMEEGGVQDPQAVVSWEPEVWAEQGSETGRGDTESVWTRVLQVKFAIYYSSKQHCSEIIRHKSTLVLLIEGYTSHACGDTCRVERTGSGGRGLLGAAGRVPVGQTYSRRCSHVTEKSRCSMTNLYNFSNHWESNYSIMISP